MKNSNSLFLLALFILAMATAYAISQENSKARDLPAASHPQNLSGVVPSANDPLAVAPAPQVQNEIEGAMKRQPELGADAIQVKVTDDTIELSGTVNSGKEKVTAYRLAQSYATNRRVKDLVTVAGRHPQTQSDDRNASVNSAQRLHGSNQNSKGAKSSENMDALVQGSTASVQR